MPHLLTLSLSHTHTLTEYVRVCYPLYLSTHSLQSPSLFYSSLPHLPFFSFSFFSLFFLSLFFFYSLCLLLLLLLLHLSPSVFKNSFSLAFPYYNINILLGFLDVCVFILSSIFIHPFTNICLPVHLFLPLSHVSLSYFKSAGEF